MYKKFIIILFTVSVSACTNDLSKVAAIANAQASIPVETSKNIVLLYSDSAIVKARLTSPEMQYFKIKVPYHSMNKGLHLEFFDKFLNVESELFAKKGTRYDTKNIVEVRDSVVVINTKGEKLTTERLIWNENTKKIYTDKFVSITTKDQVIYGEGFEANQDLTAYKIKKIRGTVALKN